MGKLIYKCDESMGSYHWETKAYVSNCGKEVSVVQTWFDDTKVVAKNNVLMLSSEFTKITDILNKHE